MTRQIILLTGKNGQIGWELERTLQPLGEVIALDRKGMDLASADSIRAAIREIRPDLIVNAAAYTAVDQAESEPHLAMAVNGVAPGIIAEEAKRLGAAIVHYSTDYVFDGTKSGPYIEDDLTNPLSVYGRTKLAGEQAIQAVGLPHLIFRTSWVYGARGKNFLLTMLKLAKERDSLRIVADQMGAPTWSRMIAEATALVLTRALQSIERQDKGLTTGIFHLTAGGSTSWYNFAQEIFCIASRQQFCDKPRLDAISTDEYPTPAVRPKNSTLDNQKLFDRFGMRIPDWNDSIALCLDEISCAAGI